MDTYKADQAKAVSIIHEILSKEARNMHGSIT